MIATLTGSLLATAYVFAYPVTALALGRVAKRRRHRRDLAERKAQLRRVTSAYERQGVAW